MIKKIDARDFPDAVEVIRRSFATVAKEFGLTEQNCPGHTSFSTNVERLQNQFNRGWRSYGFYDGGRLVGYASVSRETELEDIYEIHNLAVLPEYRRRGYGKQLLDWCKEKVKESDGIKIIATIIEENTELKNWYAENGFIHTGVKRFEHFPFTVGYMECLL